MFGLAFDPDRPLVATSAFPDGTVAAGEAFDWRAKGLTELDALALFSAGLVTHVVEMPGIADASLAAQVEQAEIAARSAPKQHRRGR